MYIDSKQIAMSLACLLGFAAGLVPALSMMVISRNSAAFETGIVIGIANDRSLVILTADNKTTRRLIVKREACPPGRLRQEGHASETMRRIGIVGRIVLYRSDEAPFSQVQLPNGRSLDKVLGTTDCNR